MGEDQGSKMHSEARAQAMASLSAQQRQLLRFAAQGRSTKEMLRMGVTLREGTIDNYLSSATKLLGASNRRHAGQLLVAFEAEQSQLSHLRPDGVQPPADSGIFVPSEPPGSEAREIRDERIAFNLNASPFGPTSPSQPSAWIELIKHSTLLKVGCSIACAIGLVVVVAGVGAIALNLEAMRNRAIGNMARP